MILAINNLQSFYFLQERGGSSLACPSYKDGLYRLVGVQAGPQPGIQPDAHAAHRLPKILAGAQPMLHCPQHGPVLYASVVDVHGRDNHGWVRDKIKSALRSLVLPAVKKKLVFRK